MKQFLFWCLFLSALDGMSQSVDRNNIIISASPGVSVNYYESLDSSGPYAHGSTYWGIRVPLSVEYAFGRVAGISLDYTHTQLFADTYGPSNMRVSDFGIGMRFHTPPSIRLFSSFGEIGVHHSRVHFFYNGDITQNTTTANGWSLYFDIGVNIPVTANQKFGIGLSLNGDGTTYKKANRSTSYGTSEDFKMNGLALSLGINFYYKL